jgi:transposase
MQWFLNLMEELGIECQVGHPAKIRAAEPRKQKNNRRDADLILKLLVENRFPSIWLPSRELVDLRALLLHRHQWVRLRTRVQNALQAIALANGLRRGPSLWSQTGQDTLASLPLAPHTAHRRSELQALYAKFEMEIERLNQRVEEQAWERPGAVRLMTHPEWDRSRPWRRMCSWVIRDASWMARPGPVLWASSRGNTPAEVGNDSVA